LLSSTDTLIATPLRLRRYARFRRITAVRLPKERRQYDASDVDALDQGGEDGALACSGQLAPALPDLGGARDEPALRQQIRKLCRLVDAAGIENPMAHSAGPFLRGAASPA
jgi:hypothetical protein